MTTRSEISGMGMEYLARGGARYHIDVCHAGLGKYRHIKESDRDVAARKAAAQAIEWDDLWAKRREAERIAAQKRDQTERIKDERERVAKQRQEKKELASQLTEEARAEGEAIANLLRYTLGIIDAIVWESLEDRSPFSLARPTQPQMPPEPGAPPETQAPPEPKLTDEQFRLQVGLLDKLFKSRMQSKLRDQQARFQAAHDSWIRKKETVLRQDSIAREHHSVELREWENRKRELQEEYEAHVKEWKRQEGEFGSEQEAKNKAIQQQKQAYSDKLPDAIFTYCDMVLANSKYPDGFPQEWELDYNPESKLVVVDYSLPFTDAMPSIKEVKYVQTSDEFRETPLSESERNKLYDQAVYQIALRTIHELYEADVVEAIDSIVFNGWVKSIDKATGKEAIGCILSLQAGRKEFLEINLAMVDPKACCRQLKGVGSSKLHSLTPVAPIVRLNKEDSRFVEAHEVADSLDESCNLAVMDWEDFEHLVRELFQKEFSSSGGDVKITRASRDGGVDAVAFDPDPIRGGKIVIQAKRYTNTVGVSAVRDLYGTVLNEGATKGILITTSDYGPDAYDFAKGKPLALMSGSNLLHLLGKHGYRAKIDLKEARRILFENRDGS